MSDGRALCLSEFYQSLSPRPLRHMLISTACSGRGLPSSPSAICVLPRKFFVRAPAANFKTRTSSLTASLTHLHFSMAAHSCSLHRQRSRAPCVLGSTFGCGASNGVPSVWVSSGCRGWFNFSANATAPELCPPRWTRVATQGRTHCAGMSSVVAAPADEPRCRSGTAPGASGISLLGVPPLWAAKIDFGSDPPHPSDRYSSAVACGGSSFLFSRRLVQRDRSSRASSQYPVGMLERDPSNEWTVVARRRLEDGRYGEAMTSLGEESRMAHNAAIHCDGTRLVAYGGRLETGSQLLWLNRRRERAKAKGLLTTEHAAEVGPRLATANAATWPPEWTAGRPLFPGDPASTEFGQGRGCNNRIAKQTKCEFDGRFASVRHRGRTLLYARANMARDGGARHVQVTSSADGVSGWAPWQLVNISGAPLPVPAASNIYFFAVAPAGLGGRLADALVALYPAALAGGGAGVFLSASRDGVHWSAPSLMAPAAEVVESRTNDYPVGWRVAGAAAGGDAVVELHIEHGMSATHRRNQPYHCRYGFSASRVRAELERLRGVGRTWRRRRRRFVVGIVEHAEGDPT